MTSDHDPFEAFTEGDHAAARRLRESVMLIAGRTDDAGLRSDLEALLAGRIAVRDLVGDERLAPLIHHGVRMFEDAWWSLSDEQRADHVAAARRAAEKSGRPC